METSSLIISETNVAPLLPVCSSFKFSITVRIKGSCQSPRCVEAFNCMYRYHSTITAIAGLWRNTDMVCMTGICYRQDHIVVEDVGYKPLIVIINWLCVGWKSTSEKVKIHKSFALPMLLTTITVGRCLLCRHGVNAKCVLMYFAFTVDIMWGRT